MINPKRDWIEFKSKEEKLEKLKVLKIISSKSKEVKDLYYKVFIQKMLHYVML